MKKREQLRRQYEILFLLPEIWTRATSKARRSAINNNQRNVNMATLPPKIHNAYCRTLE